MTGHSGQDHAPRAVKFASAALGAVWALAEALVLLTIWCCAAAGVVGLVLWLLCDLVMQLAGGVFG